MKKQHLLAGILTVFTAIFLLGCYEDNSSNETMNNPVLSANQSVNPNALKDIGDYYVLGGDMLLSKNDENHQGIINKLLGKEDNSIDSITNGIIGSNTSAILVWPFGQIPYYFVNKSEFTPGELETLQYAIESIEAACNVNFYETTFGYYRLGIVKTYNKPYRGVATLGFNKAPYFEYVYSGYSGSFGTMVHELGHVLGLGHEHQRYDRDQYIDVLEENIDPDYLSAFNKINQIFSTVYGRYDYYSVMHYPSWAFRKSYLDTIDAKGHYIGKNYLSTIDSYSLKSLYGAPSHPLIIVKQDSVIVPNDFYYKKFHSIIGQQEKTFTIENHGNNDLNLTGPEPVLINGNAEFSISEQPASTTIAPGGSETFKVRFNPSSYGNYSGYYCYSA